MKKLLALLLALLMLATMVACSDGDDLDKEDLKNYLDTDEFVNYETMENGATFWFEMIDSETITITKYKGKAFIGCTRLESLTVPATVTAIGNGAFYGCSALRTLTFAEGTQIAKISANAFTQCVSLEAVVIPASVYTIEAGAFFGCTKLASVTISEGVAVIEDQAFQNCNALAELVLPSTITEMGDFLFNSLGEANLYLEGVTYPAGNAVIEAYFANEFYSLSPAPTPAA